VYRDIIALMKKDIIVKKELFPFTAVEIELSGA